MFSKAIRAVPIFRLSDDPDDYGTVLNPPSGPGNRNSYLLPNMQWGGVFDNERQKNAINAPWPQCFSTCPSGDTR